MQNDLRNAVSVFACTHNRSAVNRKDLRNFVGVIRVEAPTNTSADNTGIPSTPASIVSESTGMLESLSLAPNVSKVSELVYSNNRESEVNGICPTSQEHFWLSYSPSSRSDKLGLFDKTGRLLESLDECRLRGTFVTVLNDVTLLNGPFTTGFRWIQPSGRGGNITFGRYDFKASCKRSGTGNHMVELYENAEFQRAVWLGYFHISFVSFDPPKWNVSKLFKPPSKHDRHFDASVRADFFAFIHEDLTSVVVYKKSGHENAQLVSTYTLNSWPTLQPSDVCFCMMAGREVLLVAVKKENKIHVVDHANGCRFISYLDTRPLTLNKPCVLATDHTRRVWIGCEGGKIVVVDL
ncbi:hypothetical protein BaRGS_00019485 [Batillaria attramentaria]|uniref:Uncharacterized protein n=1 Tax=Batillaria attramentaria TaxID=370345 RepID=A0ABD0KPQ2_9CAEN